MVGGHAERRFELARARRDERLAGPRIDQVEGEPREDVARASSTARRASATSWRRPSALQRGVVERLHAERDAVDAGGAIAAEALRLDAAGIGLQRDLGIRRDRPVSRDRIEDCADRRRLHQRRRAAAEEDAGDGAAGRQRGEMARARARRRRRSAARRAAAWRTWRVEVAIGALGRAERPVDVDAESGRGFPGSWRLASQAARSRSA